jgi:hypothetical protein
MVRRGSTVRVRQRALENSLQNGWFRGSRRVVDAHSFTVGDNFWGQVADTEPFLPGRVSQHIWKTNRRGRSLSDGVSPATAARSLRHNLDDLITGGTITVTDDPAHA